MKKPSRLLFALIAALVLTVLVAGLGEINFFHVFELRTSDFKFTLSKKLEVRKPDPRIIVIGIDDDSTREFGRWPWKRDVHAQMLEWLVAEKPSVVAWDIIFTEATDADEALVQAVKGFPSVITGAYKSDTSKLLLPEAGLTKPFAQVNGDVSKMPQSKGADLPIEGLQLNSMFGFVDCDPDSDSVRRSLPLITNLDGKLYPSLSLQSIIRLLKIDPATITVNIGKDIVLPLPDGKPAIRIPIDEEGFYTVNFRYRLGDFTGISYLDLIRHLKPDVKDPAPPLENSLTVFATTGTAMDSGAIPLASTTPLVAVHLNAIDNILHHDYIHFVSKPLFFICFFVFVFVAGFLLLEAGNALSLLVGFGSLIVYTSVSFALFHYWREVVPTFMPFVGLVLLITLVLAWRFLGERKDKHAVKGALGRYLSEKVLEEIMKDPHNVKLGGTKKEITVLFSDIRGFTRYCDERDPNEVVEVLNEYLELMTNVILKYDGTVDKYIGDAIMAFWGAPQDQPDHAQRAVCAAMEMRYALSSYKAKRAKVENEVFECGIGINTGEALVGNMGSSRFMNYSVIGANVNLAARLEALTKAFNVRIIISEATRRQIEGDFTITELGEVSVPGFRNKFRLHSVEALQDFKSALSVARSLGSRADYTAEEVEKPIWEPVAIPEDDEEVAPPPDIPEADQAPDNR